VSLWESRAANEAFAGQDIGTTVFYPDDEQFLIERDLTVIITRSQAPNRLQLPALAAPSSRSDERFAA
jgi:hypothetical protein